MLCSQIFCLQYMEKILGKVYFHLRFLLSCLNALLIMKTVSWELIDFYDLFFTHNSKNNVLVLILPHWII